MMITQKDIDDLVFRFKWSKESFKDKRVTDIYRQGIYDVVELFKQKNAMDYEKKYKEPELAESEDEKVRKVLVGFFKSYKEQGTCGAETFNGIPTDKILAWLEKQGEQKPKWKQSDNIRFSQLYDFLVNKTPRLQVDCNEYAAWLNSLKQRMQ